MSRQMEMKLMKYSDLTVNENIRAEACENSKVVQQCWRDKETVITNIWKLET